MNRRGFLLGEFSLKIILLFNLYVTFSKQDKLEKAEASLDRVVEKISEAGDSGEARYVLTEPRG